jgi:aminodeoxyfutalosine synthase
MLPAPSSTYTLRVPVSRLMLDNIPRHRGVLIRTGLEVAKSPWFGVDDLTVRAGRIYHMAGSSTPEGMTTSALTRLVRAAGREPLERDTFYNIVNIPEIAEPTPLGA